MYNFVKINQILKFEIVSSNVTKQAECLLNVPSSLEIMEEATYFDFTKYPGLTVFSADDQCKFKNGANSTYCRVSKILYTKYFILLIIF